MLLTSKTWESKTSETENFERITTLLNDKFVKLWTWQTENSEIQNLCETRNFKTYNLQALWNFGTIKLGHLETRNWRKVEFV